MRFTKRPRPPALATTIALVSARSITANYYGAFVLDLDGNNIEAVCHGSGVIDQALYR